MNQLERIESMAPKEQRLGRRGNNGGCKSVIALQSISTDAEDEANDLIYPGVWRLSRLYP
uniref:Uncharacterized protein n=1 Tax=Arundo donax TaxID=35708 RepID=A0A0A9FJQ8_ARUDO